MDDPSECKHGLTDGQDCYFCGVTVRRPGVTRMSEPLRDLVVNTVTNGGDMLAVSEIIIRAHLEKEANADLHGLYRDTLQALFTLRGALSK